MTFVLNAAAVVLRFEAKIEGLVGLTRCEFKLGSIGDAGGNFADRTSCEEGRKVELGNSLFGTE